MDRRTYLKNAFALSGGLLVPAGVMSLVGRHGLSDSAELVGFDGRVMGTSYSVRLGLQPTEQRRSSHSPTQLTHNNKQTLGSDHQIEGLAQQVHSILLNVDKRMSTWRDTSELSAFNNRLDRNWHTLSSDTLTVVDRSLQVSKQSLGAFDVSVGPLVDLWGFGATSRYANSALGFHKPSNSDVTNCLQHVGYDAIEIDHTQGTVRKHNSGAKLDLSGIAKGFAVDKVTEYLDELGYKNYLVELGGELRARGRRANTQNWRVAVERPDTARRDVLRVLNLHDSAIATSGDYRNFFMDGGQRYSHSIDPRNGYPVNHNLISVSVIANSTILADAISTAMIIMGPELAPAYAEQHNLAAHFVLKSTSGKLAEKFSTGFSAYVT